LRNIYQEISQDLGIPAPAHGSLVGWAEQGVFLLNALLTVRHKEPLSHQRRGWERFTDAVIRLLWLRSEPIVFVLWGKPAQEKLRLVGVEEGHHLVLRAPHPSPFSAHQGFFGCRHFSKINEALLRWGREPIRWFDG